MASENAKTLDIASIAAGITAPVWVDALEHWFSLVAAFLAVILLILRIYRTLQIQIDKDLQ